MLDAIGGIESIVATGGRGCSRIRAWLQVLADVLGRPVEVSGVREGSARGAALIALERLGLAVPPGSDRGCRGAAAPGRQEIHLAAREAQRKLMRFKEGQ